MTLTGRQAEDEWEALAQFLNLQTDPNWRQRPSILDQMRGWRITPGRPRNLSISES